MTIHRRKGQRMTADERKAAQDLFIKAMENTANVRAACMQAGISHTMIYQWAEHDLEFSVRFKEANTQANWLLFGEAWRRAMTGEEEYVISMGKIVYKPDSILSDGTVLKGTPLTIRKKSDKLLELLLKARLPEFRDKQSLEVTGNIDVTGAKDRLLAKLAALPDDES